MKSCHVCKVVSKDPLKSCVCKKVSYCSKECQEKDWKSHKPTCPPYIVRESPGKGKGLFATRRIKEGRIILEEYPLLTLGGAALCAGGKVDFPEFHAKHYANIDEDTKAKILKLHDPFDTEKQRTMDAELCRKRPMMNYWIEEWKVISIFSGNGLQICGDPSLYGDTTKTGLYNDISRINHSCYPNAIWSWVMGDFTRKQVRAVRTIEKDQEILTNYYHGKHSSDKFISGSREFRQGSTDRGFLCECSVCSLEFGQESNEVEPGHIESK